MSLQISKSPAESLTTATLFSTLLVKQKPEVSATAREPEWKVQESTFGLGAISHGSGLTLLLGVNLGHHLSGSTFIHLRGLAPIFETTG
jgi:hypothetical protein